MIWARVELLSEFNMLLENFELITRVDWPEVKQCVLSFGDHYTMSILHGTQTEDHLYEVEFEYCGHVENPFDKSVAGLILNLTEEQINKYIILLTILTGSHPTQV